MVMLKALEAAINQVETIQDHELTFTVEGQEITLRPLRSNEETEVQRYAQVAWEGMNEDGDTAAYQEFMDRVRLSTLGFSIVRLGDMDLHGVEWIETGESDENGNPISQPKWEAVRDLIREQWSKPLALQVFAKFGELLERVEITASRLVKFDPSDLEEEIERVEKRLAELRKKREDKEEEQPASSVEKAQKAVAQVDKRHSRMRNHMRGGPDHQDRQPPSGGDEGAPQDTSAPSEPQQQPSAETQPQEGTPQGAQEPPQASPPQPPAAPPRQPPQPPEAPQGRQRAIPREMAPPDRPAEPAPSSEPELKEEPQSPMLDEQGVPLPHDGDSFFDPSDPDAALAAEAQRQSHLHAQHLRRQRQQKMQRQRAEELGMPTPADVARERVQRQRDAGKPQATSLDPRTSGLRQAANLHDHVFDAGGGRQQTGRPQRAQPQAPAGRPQAPATLHGKPVYKMPTQTLEKPSKQQREEVAREHGEPAPSPMQVNPPAGGRQAKFRGPEDQ